MPSFWEWLIEKRAPHFIIAGAPGLLVCSVAFLWLKESMGTTHQLAVLGSLMLGSIPSFFTHKLWTFQNKSVRALPKQLALYLAFAVGMLSVQTLLIPFTTQALGLEGRFALVPLGVIRAIAGIVGYFVSRKIFNYRGKADATKEGTNSGTRYRECEEACAE